ncbi:protein MKS1 [Tripterygium wilfordii]|uniref:Protein MKS1 n=2 Tax=Tripterygium wilfordii TaxID=458696 RepID=A0A7J7DG53_TRIWF|nr:protein MKS1 [Tripterygium wilfordii]
MSPACNLDLDHHSGSRREINCLRPSLLRIHKDSHLIHKSTSSNSWSSSVLAPKQQQRRPVITYTHSPKIIHTKPEDFMGLVQKLTGRSSSGDQKIAPQTADSKSETNVIRENCDGGGVDLNEQNYCLADIPLFTPTSAAHFFCSPNKAYFLAK